MCYLLSFLTRLERLDHLAQKFKHKCDIHEEWAYGKEDMLQAQDFKMCKLNELKVTILIHTQTDGTNEIIGKFLFQIRYRILLDFKILYWKANIFKLKTVLIWVKIFENFYKSNINYMPSV